MGKSWYAETQCVQGTKTLLCHLQFWTLLRFTSLLFLTTGGGGDVLGAEAGDAAAHVQRAERHQDGAQVRAHGDPPQRHPRRPPWSGLGPLPHGAAPVYTCLAGIGGCSTVLCSCPCTARSVHVSAAPGYLQLVRPMLRSLHRWAWVCSWCRWLQSV